MKRILLTALFLTAALWGQKAYVACEATKKEAKASLINQIVSTMESEFHSEVKVTTGDDASAVKEAKKTIRSTSRLTLSEVSFYQKGEQICAQITQEKLIDIAKGKLKVIKHYNLEQLPKDEIALINYLEERLDQIKQTSAIATLMASHFDDKEIELLETKQKLLQDERSRHHAQKVSFQITPEEATLIIDGVTQTRHHDIYLATGKHSFTLQLEDYQPYQEQFEMNAKRNKTLSVDLSGNRYPTVNFALDQDAKVEINKKEYPVNQLITLTPGEHTYTVKSDAFCPLQGTFTAELGNDKTINLDVSNQSFPQVTINSNQEFAELKIDAQPYALGKIKTFKECQAKEISYNVSFDKQSRQGTVMLEPGLVKTLSVDFLTQLDIRALKNQAKSYQTGSRLILRAAYESDPISMPVYSFDKINQRGWLRYGWGALYGSNTDQTKADLHYSVAMQFTQFGSKEMPLHTGSFAWIPFFGFQAGGTYLETTQQEFKGMVKAMVGIDFVLNQFIGFELFAYKNFLYKEEFSAGIALSLKNPFDR